MSAHSISRLAKPKMRGLLTDQIKKHLLVSSVLSVLSAYAYKVMVGDPRKQTYAEFYRFVEGTVVFLRNLSSNFLDNPSGTTMWRRSLKRCVRLASSRRAVPRRNRFPLSTKCGYK